MASIAGLNREAPSSRSETAAQPADVEGTDESSAAETAVAVRAQVGPLAAEVPADAFPAAAAMMNRSTAAQGGKVMGDNSEIADGDPPVTSSTVDPLQDLSGPSESNMGPGAPALHPLESYPRPHRPFDDITLMVSGSSSPATPLREPPRVRAPPVASPFTSGHMCPLLRPAAWRCVHAA